MYLCAAVFVFICSLTPTLALCEYDSCPRRTDLEVIVTTWAMDSATDAGWGALQNTGDVLDAVEVGCIQCEIEQCDGTVGYGYNPDENGEVTLDAMIMDGRTHDVGAVAGLRRVKQAISVARAILSYTTHSLLVGEAATKFAIDMGFTETTLATNDSISVHNNWIKNNCQPNSRLNVSPDADKSCGPYKPAAIVGGEKPRLNSYSSWENHDTIGMIALDKHGNIAGGTSTNGLVHKVPGRVGDSPIAGAGAYVEQGVGGAAATGDGDVMIRFLPSFYTVSLMSFGHSPTNAAKAAISKIAKFYPGFKGAIIALAMNGTFGAACNGYDKPWPYSRRTSMDTQATTVYINCTHGHN